jgi:predicted transcriptional regulator
MNAVVDKDPLHDLRQELHALAERLPDTASWADVVEYARFRAAVAEGKAAARRGDFATDEEVRAMFAKWGVDVED